ncbi:uncharacterized protein EAF01_001968 [Botrytis porri]|uniref:uncharacterized protein n=1 Tax=Botrytis porri TaxID=87229 RepID=UPI001901B800|nr:uncharacterized protein EAF01_001968 [Botrytis porri]KAF7912947.1 hypothetical protein EAF01_001968 [Botrytis porri]
MFGSIFKSATEKGLYPAALPLFEGLSFERIESIKPVSICNWMGDHNREGTKFVPGRCNSNCVFPELIKAAGKIESSWLGLEIADYKGAEDEQKKEL